MLDPGKGLASWPMGSDHYPPRSLVMDEMMMSDTNEDRETRIRERAYTLWEEDGRPEGRADEYWARARRIIESEDEPRAPDMVADPPL